MTALAPWPAKAAQTIAGDADLDPSALVDGRVLARDATAHKFKGVDLSGIHADLVTAKGDLLAALGDAQLARLGVGANGQLVVPDVAAASGLKWVDNGFLNAKHVFGAKGDAIELTDVAMAAGSNRATSASAVFTAADVGKAFRVVQQSFTVTGDTTAGSTSIINVAGWPSGLTAQNGMAISGAGIKAGSTIRAGAGTATITLPGTGAGMGATATAAGVTLTVTGYVAIKATITAFVDAHTVDLSATWGGSAGLTGCVAVYGTDDTTALTNWLGASSNITRHLPKGDYLVTSTLDMAAGTVASLQVAAGPASRIIVAPGIDNVGVQFNQTGNTLAVTTRGVRLLMRDLRIDGYGYAQRGPGGTATAATLNIIGCDRVRLDDVEVNGAHDVAFNVRGYTHALLTGCRSDTVTFGNSGNSFNVGGSTNYGASDGVLVGCDALNVSDIGFDLGISSGKRLIVDDCLSSGGNSGFLSEGTNTADSGVNVTISGSIARDCLNIGIGASSTSATREHYSFVISGNQAINCATAIEFVGQNGTIAGNIIEGYTGTGIWIGGGDFDEYGTRVVGNPITAATTGSPSNAINVTKSGAGTNYIRGLVILANRLDGGSTTTGGQRGISIVGKIKNVGVAFNDVVGFRNSGIYFNATGGAAPLDVRVIGNDSRNNNQAGNAAGVNSVGIAIEDGARYQVGWNRCTDDQTVKTQTHGLHWVTATSGTIAHNDWVGNATGAKNVTFDTKTVYFLNREVDDVQQGTVTLNGASPSTATFTSTAVATGRQILVTPRGTVTGPVFVSTTTNGTSCVITGPNGATNVVDVLVL